MNFFKTILILFSITLLSSFMAQAQVKTTGDSLMTVEQSHQVLKSAMNYFYTNLHVVKGTLSLESISFTITDSHDYDGDFSSATIIVKWIEIVENKAQFCTWELGAGLDDAEYDSDPKCVPAKKK